MTSKDIEDWNNGDIPISGSAVDQSDERTRVQVILGTQVDIEIGIANFFSWSTFPPGCFGFWFLRPNVQVGRSLVIRQKAIKLN